MKRFVLACFALAMTVAACSSEKATTAPPTTKAGEATTTKPAPVTTAAPKSSTAKPGVIAVPGDRKTIQLAVDSAKPGDLILISPGVYNEAVDVTTDNLTLRGLDRNTVILDGQFKLDNGIRVVATKGVAIENMTARNYAKNGFFWTGAEGYRGSYLTTFRTGDYGIYAFDSVKGQLDNSYTSGSPDAGVYVGECYPCDAVLNNIVSEYNGLGYSGTNSGGNLLIVNSTTRNVPPRSSAISCTRTTSPIRPPLMSRFWRWATGS
jgi:Periplasmic copper-binding protein (NosD)